MDETTTSARIIRLLSNQCRALEAKNAALKDERAIARVRTGLRRHRIRDKINMHRGWHSDDGRRPLENTRAAYQKAAATGAGYAECDVWYTMDGVIVLSHDFNFK